MPKTFVEHPLRQYDLGRDLCSISFFDNEKVTFDSIMSGHKESTLKRIQAEPVVLIPQDTTFLNFATDDKSKEMGTLRKKNSNQQLLHTSIAISPSRVNLGIVDGSMWQREETSTGKSRGGKKIEEKESHRWLLHYENACAIQDQSPDTTVVSIADREGDIHEWFQYAETVPVERRASYIIRAKANRALELEDERISLWDHMNSLKSLGKYSVSVPKRNRGSRYSYMLFTLRKSALRWGKRVLCSGQVNPDSFYCHSMDELNLSQKTRQNPFIH